jgi:hypothetical protein
MFKLLPGFQSAIYKHFPKKIKKNEKSFLAVGYWLLVG